jgi:type IV secretory pathway VirB3-like protein
MIHIYTSAQIFFIHTHAFCFHDLILQDCFFTATSVKTTLVFFCVFFFIQFSPVWLFSISTIFLFLKKLNTCKNKNNFLYFHKNQKKVSEARNNYFWSCKSFFQSCNYFTSLKKLGQMATIWILSFTKFFSSFGTYIC